ncbi:MAG: alkene reductase [Tepidisphaera sp.]|nr:alkene reductase [Tepidisphaera sp.]
MSDLFTPLKVGAITVPNRVWMAPLTRCRAGEGNVPTPLNPTYYAQRAGAGLIISEATQISPSGQGYPFTPGIHSSAQRDGWSLVTKAVHAAGGRMVLQLWHVGRVSHPDFQPGGAAPLAPSPIELTTEAHTPQGKKRRGTPHEMTQPEIRACIEDYRNAARLAKQAGFDGVELHGANGYLPDQFLRDGTNRRTDAYGGSIANRARFMLEALDAIIDVWGPERVGVRLSPSGTFNQMEDSTPRETFGHAVRELSARRIAYAHITESTQQDAPPKDAIPVSFFRPLFEGVLVTNGGFTYEKAMAYLKEGWADAFAFGVPYIANPDLAQRFQKFGAKAPLNTPRPDSFYGGTDVGYTDYPAL